MRAAQNYFEDQEFDAIVGTVPEDLRVAGYLEGVGQLALNEHLDHGRREASLQIAAARYGDIAVGNAILAETRRQLVGIY